MIEFSIAPLVERFPAFVVGVVVAQGIRPALDAPRLLDGLIASERRQVAERLTGQELSEVTELRCWRQAYKAFGVKGTSFRCSVDRLVRTALREDRALPRISPLVDAYNVISLRHLLPVGADDLDAVRSPLGFRFAGASDSFVPLGSDTGAQEPPDAGEVVYADAVRVLCRRWNWYQNAETAVTVSTTRAVLTVQALGTGGRAAVESAMADLDQLLSSICSSRQSGVVMDAAHPQARVTSSG